MRARESQEIEFKTAWRDEYLKWICGFANAQGGRIYIGKDDHGKTVGIKNARKLLEDLPNKIRDVLGIVCDVNLKHEGKLLFLEIIVSAYPYPVSYKGQYHYRSGSTKQELKGAALDKFLLNKQGLHWDGVGVPGIGDKDFVSLKNFRKLAVKSKRLDDATLSESDEFLLDKLRLKHEAYYKRAAVLLFHPDPEKYISGAYIKIGYFASDSNLLYHDEIHGNLFKQIDQCLDLLQTKYLKAGISYEGIQRIETFPVPSEALREALLNAVAHKDYSSGAPIQISVYTDKLMIWNNGQLHAGWTVKDLLAKHASQPFNPNIANAFFRAGLIEAWGRGIEKMREACEQQNMKAPEFTYDGAGLWVTFVYSSEFKGTGVEAPAAFGDISERIRKEFGKNVTQTFEMICLHPEFSAEQIGTELNKTSRTVENHLAKLKRAGIIRRLGPNLGGIWEVIDD